MNDTKCLICEKEFPTEACLHKHIKAHKILLITYFQKYYARYDKFDGSIIKFKNKEQYFSTDFNSRENFRQWVIKTDKSIVRAYCKMVLEQRIAKKKLIWTPTQVELRSANMPPIQCYNNLYGNYYALCEELGLKNRMKDPENFRITSHFNNYVICIDSREQQPLSFTKPAIVHGLKYADYAAQINKTICPCRVERKSIQDFVGTFSGGFKRFQRELIRAKADNSYIVVIVEESLNNALRFNELPKVYRKNTCITPEFVFHNVRDLMQEFDNIQFLFVRTREESSKMIEKIFDSDGQYTQVDLQNLLDNNLI